jgi:hypothetical protein
MPTFKTLDDLDLAGKTVLVRVDFNVPMSGGEVSDATRLERAAPTIRDLTAKGAKVLLLSHFGRPKGKPNPEMSLRPLVPAIATVLGHDVAFAEDCIGAPAEQAAKALKDGGVALLENLRFHAEEEANDADFAQSLAALGDVYVNDAFSAAHRAHASTEGIAHLLPSAAGRLMQAELEHLGAALEKPKRPLAAIVGGAKISTKLDLLGNLVARVDMLVIGGGMANTFLNAVGVDVGKSRLRRGAADRRRGGGGIQGRRAQRDRLREGGAAGQDDPRRRPGDGGAPGQTPRHLRDTGVERPARRLRDPALRRGDQQRRPGGGEADEGRQAAHRRGRRRHRGRARPCRRAGRFLLRLDGRRRLPRVAGR